MKTYGFRWTTSPTMLKVFRLMQIQRKSSFVKSGGKEATKHNLIRVLWEENLLNDAIVVWFGVSVLLWSLDSAILQRVVWFPEQILAVVFQSFIENAEDEDRQHRPDEASAAGSRPLLEQNGFVVSAMELKQKWSRENWARPQECFRRTHRHFHHVVHRVVSHASGRRISSSSVIVMSVVVIVMGRHDRCRRLNVVVSVLRMIVRHFGSNTASN